MNRVLMDELVEGIEFVYKDELTKMSLTQKYDHTQLKWVIISRINKKLIQFGVNIVDFGPRLIKYISLLEPDILNDKKCGALLVKCISESGLPFNTYQYSENYFNRVGTVRKMISLYPPIVDAAIDYITGGLRTSQILIDTVCKSLYSDFIRECVSRWTTNFDDNGLEVDNRIITPMELIDKFDIHDNSDLMNQIIDSMCDSLEYLIIKAGEDVLLSEMNNDIDGFTTQLSIELKVSEMYVTSKDIMTKLFGEWEQTNYYKLVNMLHLKLVTSLAYSVIDTIKTSNTVTNLGKESFYIKMVLIYLDHILSKEVFVNE